LCHIKFLLKESIIEKRNNRQGKGAWASYIGKALNFNNGAYGYWLKNPIILYFIVNYYYYYYSH
jgi:hypothetical protein